MMLKWKGPYVVKSKVGEYDYGVEVSEGKIKTYHINMMKKFYEREVQIEEDGGDKTVALVTVVNDGDDVKEEELLKLFYSKQKENYHEVQINPRLGNNEKEDVWPGNM